MVLNAVKRLGFYLTISSIFMIIMIIFFTGFYYIFENKDRGGDIDSVGDAFYFTIIVTRTVGFGDISPKTTAGKMGTVANALLPATVIITNNAILVNAGYLLCN